MRSKQYFTSIKNNPHEISTDPQNAVRFDIMKMGCPIFVRPINEQKLQLFELQLFISAREERLELPTLGFGDRCSTN